MIVLDFDQFDVLKIKSVLELNNDFDGSYNYNYSHFYINHSYTQR